MSELRPRLGGVLIGIRRLALSPFRGLSRLISFLFEASSMRRAVDSVASSASTFAEEAKACQEPQGPRAS